MTRSESNLTQRRRDRLHQSVLIGSFLPLCWFAMMAVHEFGHVIGGWLTGGAVSKVVLYPLTISRTDLSHNPHPLFVAWAGPIVGIILPALALGALHLRRSSQTHLVRFFAGFCLIANGAYLGIGSFDAIGDAGDIMRHGSPTWTLRLFGIVTTPLGLLLWHRLGPQFGMGPKRKAVPPSVAYASLGLLAAVVALEFWLSPR